MPAKGSKMKVKAKSTGKKTSRRAARRAAGVGSEGEEKYSPPSSPASPQPRRLPLPTPAQNNNGGGAGGGGNQQQQAQRDLKLKMDLNKTVAGTVADLVKTIPMLNENNFQGWTESLRMAEALMDFDKRVFDLERDQPPWGVNDLCDSSVVVTNKVAFAVMLNRMPQNLKYLANEIDMGDSRALYSLVWDRFNQVTAQTLKTLYLTFGSHHGLYWPTFGKLYCSG